MNPIISSYYSRAIRLTPNGFSFYKQDNAGNVTAKHYKNTENAIISTAAPDFFEFNPDKILPLDVITAIQVPMLIPDEHYDDSKACEYLRLQFDLTRFAQHYSDQLAHYRALFFLEQNENTTLNNMACLPRFVCETALLYQFLSGQNIPEAILLAMNDNFADLVVLHKQEPVLINRLTRVDNMDILYHILNTIKQFGLIRPNLYVHYFYEGNSKLNKLLIQYLPNVIIL